MLISQYSKFEIKKQLNRAMLNEEFSFGTKVCNVEASVFELYVLCSFALIRFCFSSRLREWSVTYEFSDKSGVRSSYIVHLTRFPEFKNLAKCDLFKNFMSHSTAKGVHDEKLSWDNFDCCTFTYGQKCAIMSNASLA